MKMFNKRMTAPLAVAMLTMVAGSPLAHAGSRAYSLLDVTNASFFRADTNSTLVLGTDIVIQSFSENADLTSKKTGFADATDNAEDTNANNGVLIGGAGTGAVGSSLLPQLCQGSGCGAAPDYPGTTPGPFTGGDINTGEFARAAAFVSGSGLDLSVVSQGALGVDTNETKLVAEAITQTTSQNLADSLLTNGTGFTVTFTAQQNVAVGFTADVFQEIFVDLDNDAFGTQALAEVTFNFSVVDLTNSVNIGTTNSLSTLSFSVNNPAANPINFTQTDVAFSTQTSSNLVAGNDYQFTLNWGTTARLNVDVPEPAPLALFSLALLALPMAKRFKKARG